MATNPGKLQLIEDQQRTVERLTLQVANRKAEYDAARKLLDESIRRRDSIIVLGEAALKEQQPLFEGDHGKEEKKPSRTPKKAEAKAKGTDTSWKTRPVKDAITLGAIVNGLESQDPPVLNLGGLMIWLKDHTFRDLAGVGEEKAAKAADQLAEFRKAHPEFDF